MHNSGYQCNLVRQHVHSIVRIHMSLWSNLLLFLLLSWELEIERICWPFLFCNKIQLSPIGMMYTCNFSRFPQSHCLWLTSIRFNSIQFNLITCLLLTYLPELACLSSNTTCTVHVVPPTTSSSSSSPYCLLVRTHPSSNNTTAR